MERALSAPGKLFLGGEYSVLWGGMACVAAVGPRSEALVRRRVDREVHLLLEEGRLCGHATPLGVRWSGEVTPPFWFAARALDLVWRAYGKEGLGFDLALAPSATVEGHKLGLGGSARAAVLATEAGRFILDERFDSLKVALLAHSAAQQGKGSGGDVAAIFAGGVIRYRRFPVEGLAGASVSGNLGGALARSGPVDLWRLPSPKLPLAYAFAGESAPTPRLIESIEAALGPAQRDAFAATSDERVHLLEEALVRGDFVGLREAVSELRRLLAGLGPLETEPAQRILAIAESYGCTGKISGAGGGDGCVLFAADADARAALVEGLGARGVFAVPIEPEPGLRGESRRDERLARWLG